MSDASQPDIDLDAPPEVHVRTLLKQAEAHLHMVVAYGLDAITDKIDRDHIRDAHNLLKTSLGYRNEGPSHD